MATQSFSASLADYRRMAARPLSIDGFVRYAAEVLEVPADARRLGQMPAGWEQILRSYHRGPGAQVPCVFGTYWGAYNAVADWVDHTRGVRGEDTRLDSAWFGSGMAVKRRAFELALA